MLCWQLKRVLIYRQHQLKNNKTIEAKIARLAIVLPIATNPEEVKNITTRKGVLPKILPTQKVPKD